MPNNKMRCLLTATPLICLVACAAAHTSHSSHDDHDHGSHTDDSSHSEEGHFEAAAVYDVEAGTNSLAAYPGEGSFEEETFAFMVVPAASADLEGLEGAEEDAEVGKCFSGNIFAPGDVTRPLSASTPDYVCG